MKKIIIIATIIITIFLIYLCNLDQKVYYLALGDSLATGQEVNNNKEKGYTDNIKNYLKNKDLLEIYLNEFSKNGMRTTDLINDIKENKKINKNDKTITIQNALIKADLVTLSIGANDLLNKINIEGPIDYNQMYNYIDELSIDLEKLLKIIRQYCKEDIIIVGYYNPYPYLNNQELDDVFNYLNNKYQKICDEYNVSYIKIDKLFKNHKEYLPNPNDIHPSQEGYKAISNQIIKTINKTLLKS